MLLCLKFQPLCYLLPAAAERFVSGTTDEEINPKAQGREGNACNQFSSRSLPCVIAPCPLLQIE